MALIGLGVDMVDVRRFETAMTRTPSVTSRLFATVDSDVSARSLAARFAAKEAVVKALGGGRLRWREIDVVTAANGAPCIELSGAAAAVADARGIRHWHVSITHDAEFALAVVVAEA